MDHKLKLKVLWKSSIHMHARSQTHARTRRSHVDSSQSSRPQNFSFVILSRRLLWGHLLWITGLNLRSNKFLNVYVGFLPCTSSAVKCKNRGVKLLGFSLMDYCHLPVTLSAGEVILGAVCKAVYLWWMCGSVSVWMTCFLFLPPSHQG